MNSKQYTSYKHLPTSCTRSNVTLCKKHLGVGKQKEISKIEPGCSVQEVEVYED